MKKIYLDNNATTCVDEKVLEAMLPYLKENYANPSSMYEPARVSAKAIEYAHNHQPVFELSSKEQIQEWFEKEYYVELLNILQGDDKE